MVIIARAWTRADGGRYQDCQEAVVKGLKLCQRYEALTFYRLTLRCAGLWAQVCWKLERALPEQFARKLAKRVKKFRLDARTAGFEQFVAVADQLAAETIVAKRPQVQVASQPDLR